MPRVESDAAHAELLQAPASAVVFYPLRSARPQGIGVLRPTDAVELLLVLDPRWTGNRERRTSPAGHLITLYFSRVYN